MTRTRVRAAVRKAAARIEQQQRPVTDVDEIVAGVRVTALQIAAVTARGALYWEAPIQYVVEQIAPRVAKQFELGGDRVDDVAAYLLAGVKDFLVTLVGEFDVEHFEAWTAAAARQEGGDSD